MIKDEFIGTEYLKTINGKRYTGTITQDPNNYEFYNMLGFNYMFEKTEIEVIKEQLDELGIKYRSNSSIDTLRKKLDATTEGLIEYCLPDTDGEDNDR